MKTEEKIAYIQDALNCLTEELTKVNLWTQQPPTAEQLHSTEPFCVDTMPFEQWLQWIFIPQLTILLADSHFCGLPNRSDIHSMAEYAFQNYHQDTDAIVAVIEKIDEVLNSFEHQSMH